MATKVKNQQPAVRKSFLVGGGAVIGVAILAFILNTFVLSGGGGGGDIPQPSTSPRTTTTNPSGTSSSGTSNTPTGSGTSAGTKDDTTRFPKNQLTPGGRNPFQAKGGSSAPSTVTAAAAAPKPAETVKAHSWQMLDLKDGQATILVDGKKKIVKVGDALVDGYKLNSITGSCVTLKGASTFGLCPGAAPFVQ